MTAVITELRPGCPNGRPAGRPPRHLTLYRPESSRPANRSASRRRLDAAVYRRRRLLAAGLLLLAVAAVLALAQLVQAGTGGGPLTTTGAAAGPGMITAGATEYVVRPGDTLWSIAAKLAPGRDERPLVDRLVRQLGSPSLYPGEVVAIPAR
jgi:hypothetical protein